MAAPVQDFATVLQPTLDRNSWFLEHPKMKEMQEWDFNNDVQIQTTLLVYLDLCEAKNWWNVEIHSCSELRMGYITGRSSKKTDYQTVLPITTQTQVTMQRLQEYLEHIPVPPNNDDTTDDTGSTTDAKQKIITLAIADSDSTIVYYRIANGLLSSELETEAEEKANKRKRKRKKGGNGGGGDGKASKVDISEVKTERRDPFAEEEL